MSALRPIGFAAILTATVGLSACSSLDSRPNVGACPVVASLYDAERMVEVTGEERHENVGYTGLIEGVRGFCRYVEGKPITMGVEIDFAFGRGPLAESEERTYEYFLTVTRRNRAVIGKESFSVDVKFPKDTNVVRLTEEIQGISIPRATDTVSGSNFEVLVGLELTPEQLAFNRAGKRFRMQVK